MNKINILDCTLRDGGYVNNFTFGKTRIKNIIKSLEDSNIDIIECGFLSNINKDCLNSTLYKNENKLFSLGLDKKHCHSLMINRGEFDINKINKKTCIDIIRFAFHKVDYKKAVQEAILIKKKGYKVFLQPTNTSSYTLSEYKMLLELAKKNKIDGVYIVDTLGVMNDVHFIKYYKLAERILPNQTILGFHFHNNFQLAFSNAIKALSLRPKHKIIVDSSLNGIGRGAGNVPTELLVDYLNKKTKLKYDFKAIIECIYQYITPLKEKYLWGYNVPQFIAGCLNCHPNYVYYLLNNGIHNFNKIYRIVSSINPSQRLNYSSNLIKEKLKYYVELIK